MAALSPFHLRGIPAWLMGRQPNATTGIWSAKAKAFTGHGGWEAERLANEWEHGVGSRCYTLSPGVFDCVPDGASHSSAGRDNRGFT
jgi:hypothetical protein